MKKNVFILIALLLTSPSVFSEEYSIDIFKLGNDINELPANDYELIQEFSNLKSDPARPVRVYTLDSKTVHVTYGYATNKIDSIQYEREIFGAKCAEFIDSLNSQFGVVIKYKGGGEYFGEKYENSKEGSSLKGISITCKDSRKRINPIRLKISMFDNDILNTNRSLFKGRIDQKPKQKRLEF